VAHVHVHIIPRHKLDFESNDEVYEELDQSERELHTSYSRSLPKIEDKDRIARTEEEMMKEAAWLAEFLSHE
jgi:diadenosine tetraphosphate (Ap4A) HIT family hydrolase